MMNLISGKIIFALPADGFLEGTVFLTRALKRELDEVAIWDNERSIHDFVTKHKIPWWLQCWAEGGLGLVTCRLKEFCLNDLAWSEMVCTR